MPPNDHKMTLMACSHHSFPSNTPSPSPSHQPVPGGSNLSQGQFVHVSQLLDVDLEGVLVGVVLDNVVIHVDQDSGGSRRVFRFCPKGITGDSPKQGAIPPGEMWR